MSPEGTLGSPPSFRLAKVFQNEAHLGRRTKTMVQLVTRKTQMYAVCALLTPCTQLPLFFQNRLLCGIYFFFSLHQEHPACKDQAVCCLRVLWVQT